MLQTDPLQDWVIPHFFRFSFQATFSCKLLKWSCAIVFFRLLKVFQNFLWTSAAFSLIFSSVLVNDHFINVHVCLFFKQPMSHTNIKQASNTRDWSVLCHITSKTNYFKMDFQACQSYTIPSHLFSYPPLKSAETWNKIFAAKRWISKSC